MPTSMVVTDGDKSNNLQPIAMLPAATGSNVATLLAKLNEVIAAYNALVTRYNADVVGLKHCWLEAPKQ